MKLSKHQTLESILSLDKEILETYQDNTGFYIRLDGQDYWSKVEVKGMLKAKEDSDGGLKFYEIN